MRTKLICTCLTTLLVVCSVQATTLPAPIWHTMTFIDGSTKELRLMGSQHMFWYQDSDGHLYIQHHDNQWYFAKYEKNDGGTGSVVSTGVLASSDVDIPSESNIKYLKIEQIHINEPYDSPAANNKKFPSIQKQRSLLSSASKKRITEQPLLVVQVSFSNEKIVNNFQATIFGENQQSVQDYFLKNSYGNYKVVPAKENEGTQNDGVINVTLDIEHPNCHSKSESNCQSKLNNAFAKAYEALDVDFNLSKYDYNNDGSIDPQELSVMFVFAGNDKSSGTRKTPTIWPHKYSHQTVEIDGKRISAYCLFADYQDDHQSTMGVIAHELGHLMLGLPDLYSYKHDGSIGHWGLMGGGSWGSKPSDKYAGETPVNMLTWSKEASGFLKPKVLFNNGSVEIDTIKGESVIHLDPYLKQFGPRAYVENRRKNNYDQALRGEGLLITAVNIDNQFNSTGPMQVQVFQADGEGLLESGFSSGDDGDVFPGRESVTTLSDDSEPSLTAITAGRKTDISISNIISDANKASFSLLVPNSDNKSSWVTSFGRTYPHYNVNSNVLGFSIDVVKGKQDIAGIHFYAKATSVAMPMFYRLVEYPYQSRFGNAVIDENSARLLNRGVAQQGGGQVIFDEPVKLGLGSKLLVLEIENGTPEYSTQFLDAYLGDGQRKRQFSGAISDYKTNGLNRGFGQNFPFAVLFEQPLQAKPIAIDDIISTDEDIPFMLNLLGNDINLSRRNQYSIEVGQKPTKGMIEDGTYFPFLNRFGRDYFTYRLNDEAGYVTDFARVEIDIKSVNDSPQITLDQRDVNSEPGKTLAFTVTSITDVDSTEHQIAWSQVKGPQLTLNGENSKTLSVMVPDDAGRGEQYRFKVTVTDSSGSDAKQSVILTVQRKQASLLGTESLQVEYGDEVDLVPNIKGTLQKLNILEPPRNGIANIEGGKIVYRAPAQRKQALYDCIKYKVLLEDGNEWIGSFDIEVLPNITNEPLVTLNQSDSSGGSTSLPVLFILCLLFRLRQLRQNKVE
ncbi:M6 family metalloprotease domain-containing protein [Vibrio sp. L3-7]|uniref:M6 family metalloprotease domain-containing protein n=1 Tax=Vibrio sp. L3-7 TaxID=2912253 RepID=UPI0011951775|nr:M6 family metalloprotease domain-containing protein [Vibrio sp. L3-7]MCF7507047.1 M6 family metalloprotease domain-containing protein [Vibrio sp. L3-7]TVU67310.1 M6 family metalloprotease domain-containing protein [Vibrio tasmaniensis]